ncbi:MAG TPA: hypothetical protein VGQ47_02765 [Candidatus Limnocylindrales bacterium]|jgi:hypothetical protein|nr:hypothetical protein [Candidatus Limnocylindrales bacterium]
MARRLGATLAFALALVLVAGAPAAAANYKTWTPFALWEVPTADLGTVSPFETGILVKAFDPTMNIQRYLDTAQAQGDRVVVYFVNTVDYRSGTVYPSRVASQVSKIKNHPALYGYLSVKEPNWSGITISEMRSLYRAYRDADPNHRVIALLGDTPHFGTSQNPWATGVANMLWVNWYPVSCSRGYLTGAATNFPKVRSYVEKVTPWVPIWLMVQAHAYYRGDKCTPTNAQLSREVREGFDYLQAEGIVFYPWNNPQADRDLKRNPTLTSHMRTIIREVRAGTF